MTGEITVQSLCVEINDFSKEYTIFQVLQDKLNQKFLPEDNFFFSKWRGQTAFSMFVTYVDTQNVLQLNLSKLNPQ
jgi:hypothetical protein